MRSIGVGTCFPTNAAPKIVALARIEPIPATQPATETNPLSRVATLRLTQAAAAVQATPTAVSAVLATGGMPIVEIPGQGLDGVTAGTGEGV